MKILWVLNMILPNVAKELNVRTSISGGWLVDYANQLASDPNIELATITYANVDKLISAKVCNIQNYIFPGGGKRLLFNSKKTISDCKQVIEEFNPDIIHIHGTEYSMGYSILQLNLNIPIILTIQGIITRISKEYYGGLTKKELFKSVTFKEIIKFKLPFIVKRMFVHNAKREQFVLKHVKYVTGRTTWDKATMLSINDNLKYYRLNYNLREEFYNANKWDGDSIDRYTIYCGASTYPLKGLHIILDALKIIKKEYPQVKLLIPGNNFTSLNPRRKNGYEKFILNKIKKLNLEENITFIGKKNAQEVSEILSKVNVCVVSSAMEGASATICEAMMIGTPCICTYRGGMTDLLKDGYSGFYYDFSEYPVLAERIKLMFSDIELCKKFSERTIIDAENRHNRANNIIELKKIYNEIYEKESINGKM